jgi:hypothetical protein
LILFSLTLGHGEVEFTNATTAHLRWKRNADDESHTYYSVYVTNVNKAAATL